MFETPKPLAIRPSFYPLASKFNALCLQHHTDYYTANSNQSVTVLRSIDERRMNKSFHFHMKEQIKLTVYTY